MVPELEYSTLQLVSMLIWALLFSSQVNNAGISGAIFHVEKIEAVGPFIREANVNWDDIVTQTYEAAAEGLQTNYYGAKRLSEALLPLLRLSDSPRIVNVSSASGKLKYITNEWAKKVLTDAENQESLDQVLNEFLKDFKEGNLYVEGQPGVLAAYTISKAAMNAHTRILAKKHPGFRINSVCPGYVKTDINCNTGILTVQEGAESVVRLALLPVDGPSGLFFVRNQVSSLEE